MRDTEIDKLQLFYNKSEKIFKYGPVDQYEALTVLLRLDLCLYFYKINTGNQ